MAVMSFVHDANASMVFFSIGLGSPGLSDLSPIVFVYLKSPTPLIRENKLEDLPSSVTHTFPAFCHEREARYQP